MLPEHEVAQPSPVHAGIDPLCQLQPLVGQGFPRTRGDRPGRWRDPCADNRVPPHTRG